MDFSGNFTKGYTLSALGTVAKCDELMLSDSYAESAHIWNKFRFSVFEMGTDHNTMPPPKNHME